MNIDKGQTAAILNEISCEETVFDELQPGDRIRVERGEVMDTEDSWVEATGIVLRTERRLRQSLQTEGNAACRTGDLILLEAPNGELLVVTIGKFTVVRRA